MWECQCGNVRCRSCLPVNPLILLSLITHEETFRSPPVQIWPEGITFNIVPLYLKSGQSDLVISFHPALSPVLSYLSYYLPSHLSYYLSSHLPLMACPPFSHLLSSVPKSYLSLILAPVPHLSSHLSYYLPLSPVLSTCASSPVCLPVPLSSHLSLSPLSPALSPVLTSPLTCPPTCPLTCLTSLTSVCYLAIGRCFPPGTPVSSTRKLISSSSSFSPPRYDPGCC